MIRAFVYKDGNFSEKTFRTSSVREVLFKLMKEHGRIVKTTMTEEGQVVWQFRTGAGVTLGGDVKIKAGYRSLS